LDNYYLTTKSDLLLPTRDHNLENIYLGIVCLFWLLLLPTLLLLLVLPERWSRLLVAVSNPSSGSVSGFVCSNLTRTTGWETKLRSRSGSGSAGKFSDLLSVGHVKALSDEATT
jgi:hypothetical protein